MMERSDGELSLIRTVLCDLTDSESTDKELLSQFWQWMTPHWITAWYDPRLLSPSCHLFNTHTVLVASQRQQPRCFCRLQPASKALPHLRRVLCLRLEWRMYRGTRAFLQRSPTYLYIQPAWGVKRIQLCPVGNRVHRTWQSPQTAAPEGHMLL